MHPYVCVPYGEVSACLGSGGKQLDGYKRPLVGSLSANLQWFGMERVAKLESLQEIIEEMTDAAGTSENSIQDCSETMNQTEQKS